MNCDRPAPVGRSAAATAVCVAQKQRGIHSAPPPESGARGRCLRPGRRRLRVGHLALFRGGSGWPRLRKGWFDTFGSEGLMVGVGGGRRVTPTNLAYVDAPRHSAWRRRRRSFDRACWSNQRRSQRRRFQHWRTVAARCSARLAPPLLNNGGEGGDEDCTHCGDVLVFTKRAGRGVNAMPVDGLFTSWFKGEGAIGPGLPPI